MVVICTQRFGMAYSKMVDNRRFGGISPKVIKYF